MAMIKKKKLDVVRGGIAIPIPNKDNYYYMSGRKHINGGIDLGKDPKTGLEVEDGEVVKIGKNDVKVFSAVPFQNGKSPAERVLSGENAGTVFNEQEAFKDRNGLNDDGTKKKKAKFGVNWNKVDKVVDDIEKVTSAASLASSAAALAAPNPITAGIAFGSNIVGAGIDGYQIGRNLYKKDYTSAGINGLELVSGIIGAKQLAKARKLFYYDKIMKKTGVPRQLVKKTVGRRPNTKHTFTVTKEANDAVNNTIGGIITSIAPNVSPFIQSSIKEELDNRNNVKQFGGKRNIVGLYSITSNGETRLRPFPSTGSLPRIRRKAVLGTVSDDDVTYTPRPEYKRLYDKFNVKGLNRKFDKDYFRLLDKLKADENLTVADVYNGGEGTEDAKLREILGANSTYKDIFDTDKENKLYDYYMATYPDMNVVENNNQTNKIDMSTTNNKPLKSTTLKEIVITPKNVEDETEKRIAKNEKRNRLINSYLSGYHGDAVNLFSNIGGNIATTLINKRALNKMQAPPQPMSQTATKLKTNYNINPQLDNLRETAARYEEAVNNNTASSRTALARNQQNRFATALNTNNLYGTKENEETKLINTDKLNQQEVANKNVEAYNAWRDRVNAFKNAITEKKAENLVGLTQGITSGITSTIENVQQRMRDDKSILANALSHPNLPIEEFYHNGLISKRAYDAYRKAYSLKTDTKKED